MAEVNEGVQIILGRMESNPEEFFDAASANNKWRWIFNENMREVMTEPEKAAIFEGMRKVRRLEITAKAVATVLPKDEEEEEQEYRYKGKGLTATAHPQSTGVKAWLGGNK
jgi:hypothetical protein